MQKMGKGSHKVFKAVVNEISQISNLNFKLKVQTQT